MLIQCRQFQINWAAHTAYRPLRCDRESISSDGTEPHGRNTSITCKAQNSFHVLRLHRKHDARLALPEQQCVATKTIER